MYRQEGDPQLFVVTGFIDFRCGINSLCEKLISIEPSIKITSNAAFIFMCKTKDKLKILYWGGDGFWLLTHRLEKSKYMWIKEQNNLRSITRKQLEWLLDGLTMDPKNYHKEVTNQVLI